MLKMVAVITTSRARISPYRRWVDRGEGIAAHRDQIVSYCARHVTKLSQVTDAMNVSASSSILTGTIGDSSTGSFIDPDNFKESAINYFVQCQVTNQVVMAEDVTKLRLLGDPPQALSTALFTKIYGDSFISGFIEVRVSTL